VSNATVKSNKHSAETCPLSAARSRSLWRCIGLNLLLLLLLLLCP